MSLENWKNGLYVYGSIPKEEHAVQFAYEKLKSEGLVNYATVEEFKNNIVVYDVEPISNRDTLKQMHHILSTECNLNLDESTFKSVYNAVVHHSPRVYIKEEIVSIDHEGIHWKSGEDTGTIGELATDPKPSFNYYNKLLLDIDKRKKKSWWQKFWGL